MAKLSTYKADPGLAATGVDFPFGEEVEGKQPSFRVAYSGNDNYRNKMARLTRNAMQQLPGRELPPETYAKLERQALAGTVLVGWSNWEEDDGVTPIPDQKDGQFNDEAAARFLNVPVFYNFIVAKSGELERFQKHKEETGKAALKSGAAVEPKVGAAR